MYKFIHLHDFGSIDTHRVYIMLFFNTFQDYQENQVIQGVGKMALFGGTSTQINCIGSMNLCVKFYAFSTFCKNFSPYTYIK